MKIVLETERLILREFSLEDTAFIIELLNSEDWLKYIGDRNTRTEEDAKKYLLEGPIKSYRENGFGLSMVELKNENIPIGMCGIISRDTLPYPDIGFALLPAFTNKNFGSEIAQATIKQAREILALTEILAITLPNNIPSIKLLEKIGFTYVSPILLPNGT